MEPTNRWHYEDVVSVQPLSPPHPPMAAISAPASSVHQHQHHPPGSPPGQPLEFQLFFRKGGGRKTDSFKFSSEHRAQVRKTILNNNDSDNDNNNNNNDNNNNDNYKNRKDRTICIPGFFFFLFRRSSRMR